MEPLKIVRDAESERQRRYQQDGFSAVWCGVAVLVQGVLTAAVLVGLPMAISALDFEGSVGMAMTVPLWFVGGLLVGLMSPGKTFLEPVVASVVVAIPTISYLVKSETIRVMPLFMYVITALIGALFTVIGSWVGERLQAGPAPKPAD
jgi:hypothetical protein